MTTDFYLIRAKWLEIYFKEISNVQYDNAILYLHPLHNWLATYQNFFSLTATSTLFNQSYLPSFVSLLVLEKLSCLSFNCISLKCACLVP